MKKINYGKLLPVLLAYIVMGFVDIVGVATGYAKNDFHLSDGVAQLIPSLAFIWFLVFATPTGILQDKYGKRFMLNIGMVLTGIGMVIPLITYSFTSLLIGIIFLGIGNTIVQVSANPLLMDVVPREKFSSFMSLSQFIKAICSLLGPIITTAVAVKFGNWKIVFMVYAITSFIAVAWLYFTRIQELKPERAPATFKSCFGLLNRRFIVLMVLAILFIVGADVGMNSNIANYLSRRFDLSLEQASLGISLYFFALMTGRFLGAVGLSFVPSRKFLLGTAVLAVIGAGLMILAPTVLMARIGIFVTGLGSGNLFPLIFSVAVDKMPERANEISGLMIMAVSGGALIPPLMGVVSDSLGVIASLFLIVFCLVYVLLVALYAQRK
ncbi:MAG: MFS transporter [Bacteroidales bacterium]|nr:MFS transporter [Lentimicrobiaceae bacterium]MDD5693993.1 MFS transporter [Bacteroidales bacterium]